MRALAFLALVPALARAETQTRLEVEGGTEVDTNPHRVDEAAEGSPKTAGVMRLGMRLQVATRPLPSQSFRLNLVGAVKKFTDQGAAEEEDVAVLSGEARYDARLGDRPVLVGGRASYYEAFEDDTIVEVERPAGSGTFVLENVDSDFRTGDLALLVTLAADEEHRILGSGGMRFFQYKPNELFDFYGEFAALAYTQVVHLGDPEAEEPRSLDLTVQYAAQRRLYDSSSYTNVCADYETAEDPILCLMPTPFQRVDLFHSAVAELQYTGRRLFGARYELHVNDSTSFGESLVRHRVEVSATSELFVEIYLTARVLLQLNQFLDPALREGDRGTFVTIEDESRNAVFLHATRDLGERWTLEARYAFYANAFSQDDVAYRRHTVYAGLIYGYQSGP